MAQEANSWDPGSIPGRDTSFDVPGFSCLLSGPGLQLDSRYTGSRGWFGGSSGMPSAGEEDSVRGTLKHVKSSVARSGGIVLRCSQAVMMQEANSWDPGSILGRDTSFDVPESSCLLSGPGLQLDSRYRCTWLVSFRKHAQSALLNAKPCHMMVFASMHSRLC